ncbi:MAG: hypothetical protein C0490_20035, partial [Marivirga sp.]|nr:hypothetical protein [Marivirga sp.]
QPPGTPDEQWKELRAERDKQIQELTMLSRNSKFVLDKQSGHSIHFDNPVIVVDAIKDVINAMTRKAKL